MAYCSLAAIEIGVTTGARKVKKEQVLDVTFELNHILRFTP